MSAEVVEVEASQEAFVASDSDSVQFCCLNCTCSSCKPPEAPAAATTAAPAAAPAAEAPAAPAEAPEVSADTGLLAAVPDPAVGGQARQNTANAKAKATPKQVKALKKPAAAKVVAKASLQQKAHQHKAPQRRRRTARSAPWRCQRAW